jgi:hypothetical protein
MRYTYLHVGALTAIGNAQIGRDAEWRAMHRRPDALPLPGEPERDDRSPSWLARLARRRPAARARRAAS